MRLRLLPLAARLRKAVACLKVSPMGWPASWAWYARYRVISHSRARGVSDAIRFARERQVPFLGTCGGYQHAIMEAAEAFWGVGRSAHAEEEPGARGGC